MTSTVRRLLAVVLLLPAMFLHAEAPLQPVSANITLGQAVVPLYGPWKFHTGDSPVDPRTGQPLWAESDFDDSAWETVDLTPKQGALDPISGLAGYAPGWTARGHAGYWGYAWYRIRMRINFPAGQRMALAGPEDVDDAYQIFADGSLLGSFGDFSTSRPKVYYTQPAMFHLSTSGANELLAFRFWMEPSTIVASPDAGGMHSAPTLGEARVVELTYRSNWVEIIRSYSAEALEAVFFALLATLAFSLILFDRSDRAYLWMGCLFLLAALDSGIGPVADWTQMLSIPLGNFLADVIITPLGYAAWVTVWWVWFGRAGRRWPARMVAGLTLSLMIASTLGDEVIFGVVSHSAALHWHTFAQIIQVLFFGLLVGIVVDGIRRRELDGWLVLPVVLLHGVSSFWRELVLRHFSLLWFPFGVRVSLMEVSDILIAAVIALLLLRRLLLSLKRQRQMAFDVKQAQEVQQVILPEAHTVLPGLEIESEYRPAREVGGDFFQIIPNKKDDTLLIVSGDVTGKGLQAGMLVALLVGAIRSTAEWSTDPLVILRALNQRLLGRRDAQATCLALRIEKNGRVRLANAGHMAPYLNGESLSMDGALPLGMIEGAEFSMMEFELKETDRLMLLSDGVVEATDANGNLFGFDRVRELLRTSVSAAEVASAAQDFGQEDDISVISVTRTTVLIPALA